MNTLYVSDLDGTLLNSNSQLSEESKEIINTLVKKGEFLWILIKFLIWKEKLREGQSI